MNRLGLAALLMVLTAAMGCKVEASAQTGLPDDPKGQGGNGQAGKGQGGSGPQAGAAGEGQAGEGQAGDGQAGESAAGAGGQAGEGQAGSTQAGAGGEGQAGGGASGKGGSAGGPTIPQDAVPAMDGSLASSASCSDLESQLKKDASARMNALIDREIAYYNSDLGGKGGSAGQGGSAGAGGQGGVAPSEDSFATKYDYSKTNLQVQGVDEADIVKADGEFIYVLHGNVFGIVDVDPPEQMKFLTSTEIEGYPVEMFVSGGHAIIYSIVNGDPVYKAAGVTPKPRLYSDYYGWGNYQPPPDVSPSTMLTKVTLVHMPEAAINIEGEFYFEGGYLSARRVDGSVRTVVRGGAHGPTLSYYPGDTSNAGWEKLRKENQAKIDASTASDWLPYRFRKVDGKVTATEAPCEEYFVPSNGSSEYGLVQVYSFDWDKPDTVRGASVAVDADVVYGSAGSIYVAATATEDVYAAYYYNNEKTPAPGTTQSLSHSYLHRFDFPEGQAPVYKGTGTVNGRVINQFALDEFKGDLRVATNDDVVRWEDYGDGSSYPSEHDNSHVFVLRLDEASKKLNVVGSLLNIKENEELRSARFVEERGYVVTFEQIDPLFVLDLTTPEAPKMLGNVEVSGFSTYMHPLDKNHLLTIGKETSGESGNIRITGMKLQIFDVTDGLKPTLVQAHNYEIADGEVYSEAENNHKAFSYHPDKKILTFPLTAHNYDGSYGVRSTLEVFEVDVAKGFTPLAAIHHDDLFKGSTLKFCLGENFSATMRRGLFMGDVLYSVSYAGIKANRLTELSKTAGSMTLQTPTAFNFQCAPQ